jgi:hypothetical protein
MALPPIFSNNLTASAFLQCDNSFRDCPLLVQRLRVSYTLVALQHCWYCQEAVRHSSMVKSSCSHD